MQSRPLQRPEPARDAGASRLAPTLERGSQKGEGCGGAPFPLEETILHRLVALNAERAAEERRGLIRWLRPDFQRPGWHYRRPSGGGTDRRRPRRERPQTRLAQDPAGAVPGPARRTRRPPRPQQRRRPRPVLHPRPARPRQPNSWRPSPASATPAAWTTAATCPDSRSMQSEVSIAVDPALRVFHTKGTDARPVTRGRSDFSPTWAAHATPPHRSG